MIDPWTTEAVTLHEGGVWINWELWQNEAALKREVRRVHAIKFRNGLIWDAVNGWRRRAPSDHQERLSTK